MISCPICAEELRVRPAQSKRSRKQKRFVYLFCPENGKHLRAFIGDEEFVQDTFKRAGIQLGPLDE
tara:strand:- start:71 stop:268 length:198 start_codon:yes stop_codon:yes gene_type:complete